MKMSDAFELPVNVPIGSDNILSDDYCNYCAEFRSNKLAKYAAHAINNHDRLKELNEELICILKDVKLVADKFRMYGPLYKRIEKVLIETCAEDCN